MHWKNPLIRRRPENDPGGIFSVLKTEVTRIRKEGEPPQRDQESFSRYVCDLCHSSNSLSGLRQCVICGKWGCESCWLDEYYVCKSCGGIMRLLLTQTPVSPVQVETDTSLSEDEEKKD